MTDVPIMETARLILRPHRVEDFEPLAALLGSARARHMDGRLSRRQAWSAFAADVGQWSLLGFGPWAIDRRADGAFLGQVGLNRPDHFPECEIGWMLCEEAEGHGYAKEAAIAARDHAYRSLGLQTLVSYIDPENARSIALAERLGAVQDPDAPAPDIGDLVYRLPVPEVCL